MYGLKLPGIVLITCLIVITQSPIYAQSIRSVQGYLCKNVEDAKPYDLQHPYGSMGLRIGTRVEFFRVVVSGVPMKMTHYGRYAWPRTHKIGVGYIVKYKLIGQEKQAVTISRSGRSKTIEDCIEK